MANVRSPFLYIFTQKVGIDIANVGDLESIDGENDILQVFGHTCNLLHVHIRSQVKTGILVSNVFAIMSISM